MSRKTNIICTIGPATSGVDNLERLIEQGMDAARLNFSHGTHEEHSQFISDIREASKRCGKEVAILQDLQGPKIRTGLVENGQVLLEDGAEFSITVEDLEYGNKDRVGTSYKNLIKEVKKDNTILLDDGYIILHVEKVCDNDIITRVEKGGILKNNKGIITPGVSSTAPSMSEKDIEDLKFGLNAGVDSVALSFVRSEKDILELKTIMKLFGRIVPIIAKIERYEGYEDIEDIIRESDGIMVARGDLGLEMPAEHVPVLQKEIIKLCNFHGKPVVTATQMLESMINNPRPTRAEASDVANAVLDGTDCVMLSGETSVGKYPFDAVEYMDKIIKSVEENYEMYFQDNAIDIEEQGDNISDAIGRASCLLAKQIGASAIITLTASGYTAQNIAKYRPEQPIIALTDSISTLRQLAFTWGVRPELVEDKEIPDNIFEHYGDIVEPMDCINRGDYVVFVAGLSDNKVLPGNMLKVYQI